MHESRLVEDLVARAEMEAAGAPVTRMVLRLGALSPVEAPALAEGIRDHTTRAWGRAPAVEIEASDDPTDAHALAVVLKSVTVGSL